MEILSELSTAASAVDGVTVPARWGERPPRPPMALIEMPDEVVYDAGGTGFVRLPDVPLVIVCGGPTDPAAFRTAARYADTEGPASVKWMMEGYPYTACSTVRVATASPDVVDLAGTTFLAMIFHIDVTSN